MFIIDCNCNQQIVWADIHRTLQRDVGQPLVAEVAPHPAADEGQGPVGPGGMGVGLGEAMGHGESMEKPQENHGKMVDSWDFMGFTLWQWGIHGFFIWVLCKVVCPKFRKMTVVAMAGN